MVQHSRRAPRVSFVVRVWLEDSASVIPDWRFEVRHVQSGEQLYCRQLVDVLAFIECQAGRDGPRLADE
jgi:hypothetical protein